MFEALLLLKETPPWREATVFTVEDEDHDRANRIRCPKCRWQPKASSRWMCVGSTGSPEPPFQGCGHAWNTFETRGRCPSCDHLWKWTACLSCGAWSRHDDWYEVPVRLS